MKWSFWTLVLLLVVVLLFELLVADWFLPGRINLILLSLWLVELVVLLLLLINVVLFEFPVMVVVLLWFWLMVPIEELFCDEEVLFDCWLLLAEGACSVFLLSSTFLSFFSALSFYLSDWGFYSSLSLSFSSSGSGSGSGGGGGGGGLQGHFSWQYLPILWLRVQHT